MKKHPSLILPLALLIAIMSSPTALAQSAVLPASMTMICGEAFMGDTSLIDVTVPDKVTSIGDRAFMDSGLKNITLPDSLNTIIS